jgi:hypothetical protein
MNDMTAANIWLTAIGNQWPGCGDFGMANVALTLTLDI